MPFVINIPKPHDIPKRCKDCGYRFSTNEEKTCKDCGSRRRHNARSHDARARKYKAWEARHDMIYVSKCDADMHEYDYELQYEGVPLVVVSGIMEDTTLDRLSRFFPIRSQAEAEGIENIVKRRKVLI